MEQSSYMLMLCLDWSPSTEVV